MCEEISAVVVAAGKGERFGSPVPKPFISLKNKPLFVHALLPLEKSPLIKEIILVVEKGRISYSKRVIKEFKLKKVNRVISGGKERQTSVEKGLSWSSSLYTLIHDGVRPFLKIREIERLFRAVKKYGAAILGTPVPETLKEVDRCGFVKKTYPRENFYLANTPQIFRSEILRGAFKKAREDKFLGTDSASLVERLGYKVKIVEGSRLNIKITKKEDLFLAGALLK